MSMNDPKGSRWRKWDLHIHTPKSIIQDYGGDTSAAWDAFIAKIASLPAEIKAIAINDYLFCDGYEYLLSRRDEIPNIELIIPSIEFRLDTFSGTERNTRRHNFHVFFDPLSVSVEDIREQLLAGLSNGYRIEDGAVWQQTPTERSLKDLGCQIKEAAPANNTVHSKPDLEVGFDNITYKKEDILKLLEKSCFDGKFLTAIGYSEWDNSRWDQSAAEKRTLINDADFCLSASLSAEQVDANREDLRNNNLNSLVLHSSDAHEIDRIGRTFLWIKADTTFEGLRQVIYEPDLRVSTQERNPSDPKPTRVLIDKISYLAPSGTLQTVELNSDLNSIIGARGSGKSTLLRNIAHAIDPTQFTKRDRKKPYPLAQFTVVWGDGQKNEGTENSPKSVFYIPQGYLSSLSYDDGDLTKERDAFLTVLLKNNTRFARAVDSFGAFVGENELKIQSGIQDLVLANRNLSEANEQLKKLGSSQEIQAEIDKKNAEMQRYKGADLSDEELSRYSSSKKDLDDSAKLLDTLSQDKEILGALLTQDVSIFVSENDLSPLSPSRRELIRNSLREKGRQALAELIRSELEEIENQIAKCAADALIFQKSIDELRDKVENNKALTDLSRELLSLANTKTDIAELSERRERAVLDYQNALSTIVNANNDFKLRQAAIYGSVELADEFKFVNINISTKYDIEQLKAFVERNINTRDSTSKSDPDIETLFSQTPVELSAEVVKKVISNLMEGGLRTKAAAGDVATVLGQLLKNRYIIDYPESVKSSDGEIHFKDMTGGQRAITFLELIFSLSDEKYPILIDQPEDDLDVSGIANDLVSFIVREKADRQIVVVSHNANLVVCADSEEIISSRMTRDGQGNIDFVYATGSIENSHSRQNIIDVLEGGETAIKKRMQKLRIKNR